MLPPTGSPASEHDTVSICARKIQDLHHSRNMVANLYGLQQCGSLCDVTLITGDKEIHVHRVVLAACSKYFHAMFTGNLSESCKSEIKLKDIDGDALCCLINYAYSGIMQINDLNVQTILETADLLQFQSVKSLCCDFIIDQLNIHNCLDVLQFAEQFHCEQVKSAAQNMFNRDWQLIVKHDSFKKLDVEVVKKLIINEDIEIEFEELIFQVILAWIGADADSRLFYLPEFLRYVRWPYIRPVVTRQFLEDPLILRAGRETKASVRDYLMMTFHTYSLPMRKAYAAWLCVIGGEQSFLMELKSSEYFDHSKASWDYGFMLNGPRTSFAAVVHGDRLFVIGGMRFGGKLKIVECYDQRLRSWKRLASLKKCQGDVEAAIIDDEVYVAGGSSEGEPACRYMERLDESNNQWHTVASMKARRRRFALTEHNGKLFAFGGFDDSTGELRSAECYDPDSNSWEYISPMSSDRCDLSATVLSGCIYVCGGVNLNQGSVNVVERYDPLSDTWTSCTPMKHCRGGHAVVTYFGRIVAVGGMNSYMQICRDAEWYNEVAGEWSLIPHVNVPRFGCAAVVLPFCSRPRSILEQVDDLSEVYEDLP